jgi:hypothetical protein
VNAYSTDAGKTWHRTLVPFSRCTGGTAQNGGDWERVTNTVLTASPNGTVHQIALAFDTGPGGSVIATRSTDGGRTWAPTIALRTDLAGEIINDKPTITADPNDSRFVYATWHRLDFTPDPENFSHFFDPTWFTRSTDGGQTWEAARPIFDPGLDQDTFYDQVAVLPNGDLVLGLTYFPDGSSDNVRPVALRSTDHGATWSGPIFIDGLIPAGGVQTHPVFDPTTGAAIRALGTFFIAADPRPERRRVYAAYLDNRGGVAHVSVSRSTNGGQTWSAPVRINHVPTAQAFPQWLAVNSAGVVSVLYDDLRNDTSDPAVLQANAFLASCNPASADCSTPAGWTEVGVGGTFDLSTAPNTSLGYALGDAQSIVAVGCGFVPMVVVANSGDTSNRTDVFVGRPQTFPIGTCDAL